jgi:hypothetical protein
MGTGGLPERTASLGNSPQSISDSIYHTLTMHQTLYLTLGAKNLKSSKKIVPEPGMVAHTCNPSIWEAKAREFRV